jgi:hypothetical protein
MYVEQLVEWELAGETKYLENCLVPFCPQQMTHDLTWNRNLAYVGEKSLEGAESIGGK